MLAYVLDEPKNEMHLSYWHNQFDILSHPRQFHALLIIIKLKLVLTCFLASPGEAGASCRSQKIYECLHNFLHAFQYCWGTIRQLDRYSDI